MPSSGVLASAAGGSLACRPDAEHLGSAAGRGCRRRTAPPARDRPRLLARRRGLGDHRPELPADPADELRAGSEHLRGGRERHAARADAVPRPVGLQAARHLSRLRAGTGCVRSQHARSAPARGGGPAGHGGRVPQPGRHLLRAAARWHHRRRAGGAHPRAARVLAHRAARSVRRLPDGVRARADGG